MSELKHISARISIEFETSTHIGAGHGNIGVNRVVRRTADGRMYVPASALKGALRMAAERLMQWVAEEGSKAHLQRKGKHIAARPCLAPIPENMCQSKSPCLVCRVFGNGWTGMRLLVDDAVAAEDTLTRLKKQAFKAAQKAYGKALDKGTISEKQMAEDVFLKEGFELDRFVLQNGETLTRAQIDRKRRGTAKGALFTSEYMQARQTFETRLSGWLPLTVVEDIPPLELVLLAASIGFVDQIGGEASTGHGRCKLSIISEKEHEEGTIHLEGKAPYTRAELIEAIDFLPFLPEQSPIKKDD